MSQVPLQILNFGECLLFTHGVYCVETIFSSYSLHGKQEI